MNTLHYIVLAFITHYYLLKLLHFLLSRHKSEMCTKGYQWYGYDEKGDNSVSSIFNMSEPMVIHFTEGYNETMQYKSVKIYR